MVSASFGLSGAKAFRMKSIQCLKTTGIGKSCRGIEGEVSGFNIGYSGRAMNLAEARTAKRPA
ncbi:MAG: hypothetical protein RLZZ522_1388 [Verrucomicrobiota bacterium]|jgi:hypothetical protein